jgi:hypothetical protein
MAVMPSTSSRQFEPIDPNEKPPIQEFDIRLPTEDVDADKVVMTYDRLSDTLLLLFYGRDRLWVATGGASYLYALVDPTTEELVGWQIEDFLARAVKAEPRWVEALDYAELLGMTIADVREVRHQVLGYRGRFWSWLAWARHSLTGRQQRRTKTISAFLARNQGGLFAKLSAGA